MGISRESLGQIRNIIRKLDDSIDTMREQRLSDNERRLAGHDQPSERSDEDDTRRAHDLDRRIG